jgi:hypothetical protein
MTAISNQFSGYAHPMRKLPILSAFTHAVKSTWNNLPFAFHVSWPWLLLLIPVSIWGETEMPTFDVLAATPAQQAEMNAFILKTYVSGFVSMVIYASIAISWHLYILKDEVPQGLSRLRFDRMVWRYFGNSILVVLFATLALFPLVLAMVGFGTMAGLSPQGIVNAVVVAAVLIALPVTYRMSVKLPAIALGRREFTFGDAWNATRGNSLQLIGLGLMAVFVAVMTGMTLGLLQDAVGNIAGDVLKWPFVLIRQLAGWVLAIFAITMLTSLYGFFVEKRDF